MGQQITTTVDDEIKEWVESMNEDLGLNSEAEVQRRCLRAVRAHDDPHSVLSAIDDTDVTAYDVREEIQALRERVSALEDNTQDTVETPAAQNAAGRPHSDQRVDGDWVSEHGDWEKPQAAETDARNRALADAYNRLHDAGELQSSAVIDVYDDHDLTAEKSHWKGEIRKVLATLPGVDEPSKGQSTYHFRLEE
jgi:hypothetical protein